MAARAMLFFRGIIRPRRTLMNGSCVAGRFANSAMFLNGGRSLDV